MSAEPALRTVGLVGGLAWETSAAYYRRLNERVRERLGAPRSAPCVLYSFDYAEVEPLQLEGRWDEAAATLTEAALRVERAGADVLVLCTNTLHRVADRVEAALSVPLLHIGDAVARTARAQGYARVGLLGSRSTMEQPFLRGRLAERGLEVYVPDEAGRAAVHGAIFEELAHGLVEPASRRRVLAVVEELAREGAEAVVLANFELDLLLGPGEAAVPTFQSVYAHADAAADAAMGLLALAP